ncbi:MobA/MobL family protein [Sphingorhabdus sp.]|uniref:MobA/MobL family protein n=1 Tax=Sphingorhabdus sp. TaxID=1902408 RepID=UPI003D81BAB0
MFERDSHGDAVSLDLNRPSAAIAATLADPNCDAGLREAMENYPLPHMGEPVRIKLKGSNKDLRRLLTTHGMNLSKIGKNTAKLANDGIVFHTGRSGRTHFRWVFELPVEFTAEQRAMVLEDLGAHMDQEKCMYAAVIHAPDPHNDQRNCHLHLIFYDRPCRRLNGTEADFDNVAETFQEAIRDEMARGHIKTGEWDFATQRHYLSIRSWKIHYPFRAEKSREITKGKDWQARFRRNYAAIVNDVSARTGGGGSVYDPRSYTDRNVDITPSKHLGQLHASEVAGIPTLIGLSNEANQANDDRRAILARHNAEMARLAQLQAKLEPYRPGANVSPIVSTLAKLPLSDIADAKHAADATLAMDLWLLETARERSRATLVHDRQKRASQKGRAYERQQRQELATAAEMHLAGLDRQDAAVKTMVNCVQHDLDSSRKITSESVERAAANCANLSRLVAIQPSENMAATPTPESSVAYPALRMGAASLGIPSPAPDEAYGGKPAHSSLEPVPVQSDKADIFAESGYNPSLNGEAEPNEQPPPVSPSLDGPAKPILPRDNAAIAEPPPTPAVASLPDMPDNNMAPHIKSVEFDIVAEANCENRAGAVGAGSLGSEPYPRPEFRDESKLAEATTDTVDEPFSTSNGRLDKVNGSSMNALVENAAAPSATADEPVHSPALTPNAPAVINDATKEPVGVPDQMSVRGGIGCPNADRQTEHIEAGPQISSGTINNLDAVKDVVLPIIASPPEDTDANVQQESMPAGMRMHNDAGGLTVKPHGQTSTDVPVQKPPQAQEGPRGSDHKPRYSGSSAERDAAVRRSEFETKAIVHIVRTERILLKKVEGKLVLPDHKRISAEWHRHVPFLQIELERDQRLIRDELAAFVLQISNGRYDANSTRDQFFQKIFEGQPEVVKALDERQQKAAADRMAEMRHIEFEKEIIIHIVRTERILLEKVNGRLVLPKHKRIPAELHRHARYLQYELERDQRLIRDELKAFAKHIGTNSYNENSDYAKFLKKVFEGQPEVVKALDEKPLARQHAFAARQDFGLL